MSGLIGQLSDTIGGLVGRRPRWQMDGKVVVVTSAGSGIGRELARRRRAGRGAR